MSNAQAERAISQLYESDSLRSELRDEEASLLLMWGEARLNELAQRNLPDIQFDHLSAQFRSLLTAINVCVGKRKTSPSQHLPMMASISSAAEASGFLIELDDQTSFLKQQGTMTNQDAISELLGLLKPAELPQPPPPISAEAAAESAVSLPAPDVVQPISSQPPTVSEPAPEIITPQAVPDVMEPTPPQPPTMNEPAPEIITPQAAPDVMEPPPPQPPTMNEPAPEIITPQAAPDVMEPPPPQPPTMNEPAPEIITPQAAPEVVDSTLPPQPEDLPELPPHPPQEG